jgi:hypothetical protein
MLSAEGVLEASLEAARPNTFFGAVARIAAPMADNA